MHLVPPAGGVRHRDGQPVLRHRHRDRERGAGRDRGAGLRLAFGQAEPRAAAHLLHLHGARQRHDPADHHGGVHPEPDDQPDRRGRGDDEVGGRAWACRPPALILALIVFYLILGMFMDVLSMQVATIPITYPIATALGVDPIWFGIFIVLMCELGLITPPVGMNLFVVHGIRPDKGGIEDAIWGALPYAVDHDPVHAAADGRAAARDLAAGAHVRRAMNETALATLGDAARGRLRDASFTPIDALQACLARSARSQPAAECAGHARRRGRGARRRAKTARWRAGRPLGALDGVPVTIKDNLQVRGLPTHWGSRALAGLVAERDELPVAKLREAGNRSCRSD